MEHNSQADSLDGLEVEADAWPKLLGLLLLDMKLLIVDEVFMSDWVKLLSESIGNPNLKLDVELDEVLGGTKSRVELIFN